MVSGDYVWNQTQKGKFESSWSIEGDKNCTQVSGKPRICQTLYAYEDGFMEVTDKGKVHAVSKPAS